MGEETTNTQRISIPGDTVTQALNRLATEGELDEAGRADIWWFYSCAMENEWNLEDAGNAINMDATTVHRLFTGRYGARYDGIVEAVRKYRALHAARGNRKKISFVETSTWQKIDAVCRHALVSQVPVFIFGDSQVGKTTCLKEFARRNNHGQTKYMELPACSNLKMAMAEMARACYLSPRLKEADLNERLPKAITGNMLLIVDEFHLPFVTSSNRTALRIIEWLRKLYDKTQCGMVFSSTRVGKDELETGPHALVLEQFRRRGIIQLELPPTPPKADIIKFAKAFGLPPPEGAANDIITTMLQRSGIKQYVVFLQSASNLATNQKKPVSWDHFVAAYDKVQSLSKG